MRNIIGVILGVTVKSCVQIKQQHIGGIFFLDYGKDYITKVQFNDEVMNI